MSVRLRVREELAVDVPPELPDELELVEYFVLVVLDCGVFTSVPNLEQDAQSCNSAPSTLTVFGDDVSAPHISH